MATIARVTGLVLNVNTRSGTSRASGEPYHRTSIDVLVGGRGVTTVDASTTEWTDKVGAVPPRGEVVDLLVDLDVFNSNLQVRPVGLYSDDAAAAVYEALASA